MTIRFGTCSWTDPTLIKSGFYPKGTNTPEERLKYYAGHFDTVEVDSTYYSIPSEKVAGLWAGERTPEGFTFHIKAYSALTGHPVDTKGIPLPVRDILPKDSFRERWVRINDEEALKLCFRMFGSALRPIKDSGNLGVIVFQFPPWFLPKKKNYDYILKCKEYLPDEKLAIEFRHISWLVGRTKDQTMKFLRENNLTYISVDEPQFPTSPPQIAEATSDIAYIRFHGRNKENWFRKGIPTDERYNYLYSKEELKEWTGKIKRLEGLAKIIYAMFNNCHGNKAIVNAMDLKEIINVTD